MTNQNFSDITTFQNESQPAPKLDVNSPTEVGMINAYGGAPAFGTITHRTFAKKFSEQRTKSPLCGVDRTKLNKSRHSSTGHGDRRNKNRSVISQNSYGVVERNKND